MTLILGLLTDQYVALVSDRRLTWKRGSIIDKQEDSDTKTIIICGHFLMGFTGFARFRNTRMERWVADTLSKVEPDPDALTNHTFDALCNGATREFARLSRREQQETHAYLIVGYVNDPHTRDLRPARLLISNSLNDRGQLMPRPTGASFKIAFEPLGNRRQLLTTVGYAVPRDLKRKADTAIRRMVRKFPDNPAPTVNILIRCLRIVAENSNEWVGKNAMIASLPRRVVPASSYVIPFGTAVDSRSNLVTGYVRSEAKTADEAQIYAPAVVCPRMQYATVEVDPERLPPRQ